MRLESRSYLRWVLAVLACSSVFLGCKGARTDAPSASGGVDAGGQTPASGSGAGVGASGTSASGGKGGMAEAGKLATEAGRGGAPSAGRSGGSGTGSAGSGANTASSEVVYVSTGSGTIHVLGFDLTTGLLSKRSTISGGTTPSYMAFSPNKKFAYAVNEANQPDSKVLAFAIDAGDGHLTKLNETLTGATGAPHLAVHPSGEWLAVAHYGRDTDMWQGGQTVVIPIKADGTLGQAGPASTGPADAPCKNAHQVVFSSDGKHLLVPCLGSDYVVQYQFAAGALSLQEPPTTPVAKGVGPRHIALHPNETYAYLVTELGGTVIWFKYDAAKGTLSDPKTLPSTRVAKASTAEGWSAHIAVHPTGKWLYTSNRMEGTDRGTENSIGLFTLAADGTPTPVPDAFVTDMIAAPRDFSIDPTGQYLFVSNEAGEENVVVFRIDASDGRLTRTQAFAIGGKPAFTHALILDH